MTDSRLILKRIYEITQSAISNSPPVRSGYGVDFSEVTAYMMAAGMNDRITKVTDEIMYFKRMSVHGLLVSISLQVNVTVMEKDEPMSFLKICGSYFTVYSSYQAAHTVKTLIMALNDADQFSQEIKRNREKELKLKRLVQNTADELIKSSLNGLNVSYRVIYKDEKVVLDIKMKKKLALSFDLYYPSFAENLESAIPIIEKMTALLDCGCHFNLKNYGNDIKWIESE